MLGQIIAVTVTVASLGPVQEAYSKYLDYKVVEQGKVQSAAAKSWGASKVSGKPYVLMQPASGAPHYIRFVVSAPYPEYETLKTYGWNATELLVQDTDATAAKLRGGPFNIVGEPRGLGGNSPTKAMQVVGPAKELLYLTNPAGEANKANSPVDRYFMIINGSRDLGEISAFYKDKLGVTFGNPMEFPLSTLNKHYGFEPTKSHKIAVGRLTGGPFSIEIDQFPKEAKPRVVRKNDLAPGMSLVTFEVESLDAVTVPFIQKPTKLKGKPYDGRRVAVIKGPNDELYELVETGKK